MKRLKVKRDKETGGLTLLDPEGEEVEGVMVITHHSSPQNDGPPSWLTFSIDAAKVDVEGIEG